MHRMIGLAGYRTIKLTDEQTRVVLVVALVERWTRYRKVAGSTPGRGAIKSTSQLSLPSLRGR